MTLRIAGVPEERMPEAYRAFTTALMMAPPNQQTMDHRRASWFTERAVVAYDDDHIVAHAGSLPFETLLPGGAMVPTAGLSRVGVLASHRRRGALTQMMDRHLREARERGEILGSLRAAEAAIYGRFGYGLAGLAASVRVKTARGAFREPVELSGRFEVLQGPALIEAARAAYRRCLLRPGMLARPDWYWNNMYQEHVPENPTVTDWGVVHYDSKDRPDGFARWSPPHRDAWEEHNNPVSIDDLFGSSFEVEAALWRFVLDLDLVGQVTAMGRPIDEAVRHRLVDVRAFEMTEIWDEQWVRVLDVPSVLAARTYDADDSIVLEVVADPLFEDNNGRFETGNGGARRVRRSPDVTLAVGALGAVIMGGTSFTVLAQAGLITERRRGGVARADRLFHSAVTPWCGSFF